MNKNNLKEIIQERDKYAIYTHQWQELNALKNHVLAEQKPSTKEVILYFDEVDLKNIPEGFSKMNKELDDIICNLDQQFASRFTLEYASGVHRHPIPYILVKNKDKYFFILREGGSGESRLIGKIGLLGGHIGIEDKTDITPGTISHGMFRELEEEAKITDTIINSITIKGFIKSNENVDADHLGIVYEIEIDTDTIKAEEEGVLSGIWVDKNEIENYVDRMENWLKIVYNNVIKEEIK